MKRAVLLHGTSGSTTHHWFPWLKKELETNGYEVFAPDLPDNNTPNRNTYEKFLRDSDWDFTDNIVIGHSSGATTVLNLLSADWFPHVKAAVLVGAFLNEKLTSTRGDFTPGQFDQLFLPSYDPQTLKQKASSFYFVHSQDDPYCDYRDALTLCEALGGQFIEVKNGGHLSSTWGVTELPGLIEKMEPIL